MLVNNARLCRQANMSTLMQRIINMWNECELIKMNWCKWCAILLLMTRRHNLTKTICRKYAVCFWNKSSTLHCFGDSPIRQFLCVGRCEVHISLDKFKEKGKIFQHDFRINRYEMKMIVLFMVFTRTSIFIAWSRLYAVPFTVCSSKRGRWVSAWSTRHLDTTTTRYRTWLPVPPLRPLAVNCAFNSTCISEGQILRSWNSG